MNINQAVRLVSENSGPNVTRIPAFSGLPPEIQKELHDLLAPFVARGVAYEIDPVLPDTLGLLLEGRLFRVSVVTDKRTNALSIAILGPDLAPWTRDMLEALLPDEDVPVAEAPPVRLGEMNIRRSQVDVLEDILTELRTLNARLP